MRNILQLVPFWPLVVALCSSCAGSPEVQESVLSTPADSLRAALVPIEHRIVEDPDNAELYAERAAIYLAYDSTQLALQDLRTAVSLDSTDLDYRLALGDLCYSAALVDQSREQFAQVLVLDADNTEALLKMAEIELVLRNYSKCFEYVNNALRADVNLPQAYYLKGWAYKEVGDTTLAISSMRTACEQDPAFYDAFMQLALLCQAQGDALAGQYLRTCTELKPMSSEAWYNRGMWCQANNEDSVALACYARIKTVDEKNALPWYNTGWIYLERTGNPEAAVAEFTRALELLPTYHEAFYNRGLAYERTGSLDSAAADYVRTLSIMPSFDLAANGMERLQKKGVRLPKLPG
jgi:tetratricopeptide (TPR) repeat protein